MEGCRCEGGSLRCYFIKLSTNKATRDEEREKGGKPIDGVVWGVAVCRLCNLQLNKLMCACTSHPVGPLQRDGQQPQPFSVCHTNLFLGYCEGLHTVCCVSASVLPRFRTRIRRILRASLSCSLLPLERASFHYFSRCTNKPTLPLCPRLPPTNQRSSVHRPDALSVSGEPLVKSERDK